MKIVSLTSTLARCRWAVAWQGIHQLQCWRSCRHTCCCSWCSICTSCTHTNTAGFWINNKMMKINDDGGNDDHGLLWRKAMMMMRKPWRHWLERREPMLNQMVRQPQKSLSFSSLSWPGSTTSTTKVAWLYFKTHNIKENYYVITFKYEHHSKQLDSCLKR